jgi:hypothetical protein
VVVRTLAVLGRSAPRAARLRRFLPLAVLTVVFAVPGGASGQTRFRFPADDPGGELFMAKPIIGVDHDPTPGAARTDCVNYAGEPFPWCYEGHDGSDFMLRFGFGTMDSHDVRVAAGAAGVVVAAHDGEYDRCHGDVTLEVSCDGHPKLANSVTLRHADGLVSKYWHLKKGSVAVKPGEAVVCGQLLGFVGSSGESAAPHLHFELESAQGQVIDPFAGPKSQPLSYWTLQAGPLGWPGDRCAGEPYLEARPDFGVARGDGPWRRDSTAAAGAPPSMVGCAVGASGDELGVAPLALLALVVWSRATVRKSSPRRQQGVGGIT